MFRKTVLLSILFLLSITVHAQAATLIDNFDDYDDLATRWWSYSDGTASKFTPNLDKNVFYDGVASLRLDLQLTAEGYGGVGFDYGFSHDWREGEGIVLQVRGNTADVPLMVVLYVDDPTQTSNLSPLITPFACAFSSGQANLWTEVILPWSCFERLEWIGTAGMTEFIPHPVAKFEITIDSPDDQPVNALVWIDNIRVLSETDLNELPEMKELFTDIPALQVNQIGYRPEDPKWFISNIPADSFTIIGESGEVFSGKSEYWGYDEDAETDVYRGRFDELAAPGIYHIVLETGDESYPFAIGDDVYNAPLLLAARALYLQRSGIALRDIANSGFDLDAGHTQPALLWTDQDGATLDVSGGWYDAGDYGRYIPTTAFAVNQLLYGFEANPDVLTDGTLNIPESGNGLPDLLDEIRWGLDWMLKMQREDGAVHHKVTTREFPSMFGALPAEDTAQLYVFDVTTADTAYFAAATAQAARIFEEYDAEYAAALLDASRRAWVWLEQHPEEIPTGGFQNPPVSEYPMQGGYEFISPDSTARLWASAELFRTTGETAYEDAFVQYFGRGEAPHTMTWANVYPMALYAYLTSENPRLRSTVTDTFRRQTERIFNVTASTGYNVALTDQVEGFEYV